MCVQVDDYVQMIVCVCVGGSLCVCAQVGVGLPWSVP